MVSGTGMLRWPVHMSDPKSGGVPCAKCGKPGSTTVCSRCKKVAYCSKKCQVEHWKRGGHKRTCKPLQPAQATTPVPDSAAADKAETQCYICLGPCSFSTGCACRGTMGFVHPTCLIEQVALTANSADWMTCQLCGHEFTGLMRTELATEWYTTTRELPKEDKMRIQAGANLAVALFAEGDNNKALALFQEALEMEQKVYDEMSGHTLTTCMNIANVYYEMHESEKAEIMYRTVRAAQTLLLGSENPHTITTGLNLASALHQGKKYHAAEKLFTELIEVQTKTLGPNHPDVLQATMNLANTLCAQGKLDDAIALFQNTLKLQKRVVGTEHRDTLATTRNLAITLKKKRAPAG